MAATAEITWQVAIKYKDKAVPVPDALIIEHDDKRFLKIRPTNQFFSQCICGKAPKNSSFSSSAKLASMLSSRNDAGQKLESKNPEQEQGEEKDLFQEQGPPAKKKRVTYKDKEGFEIVTINVGDVQVETLWGGKRPSKADLCILLDPVMVGAVFKQLEEDAEHCFSTSKRSYIKKKDGGNQNDGHQNAEGHNEPASHDP